MSVLVFQGAKDLQSTPKKKEKREREDYTKMGGDGSPHLVCSGTEACKDLKLIRKPHMRPVHFYGQKLPLQEA